MTANNDNIWANMLVKLARCFGIIFPLTSTITDYKLCILMLYRTYTSPNISTSAGPTQTCCEIWTKNFAFLNLKRLSLCKWHLPTNFNEILLGRFSLIYFCEGKTHPALHIKVHLAWNQTILDERILWAKFCFSLSGVTFQLYLLLAAISRYRKGLEGTGLVD